MTVLSNFPWFHAPSAARMPREERRWRDAAASLPEVPPSAPELQPAS